MVRELTSSRSSTLNLRILKHLSSSQLRPPKLDESEPSYTKSVLFHALEEDLKLIKGIGLKVRGDGAGEKALPSSALEIPFYPDLAVSLGKQNLWAAEVKLLRRSGRQSSIASAIGQATLYRTRYEHVAVILIDTAPSSTHSQKQLVNQCRDLGLNIVIRPRIGKMLIPQKMN